MATAPPPDHSLDHESRGHVLTVVVIVFMSLSSVVLAIRLFTKIHLVSHCGVEDYAITVAWVFTVVFAGFAIGEVKYGCGKHIWTLLPETIMMQLKCLYWTIIFYRLGLVLVQTSIVLQYLKIFPAQLWTRRLCWVFFALIWLWNIPSVIAQALSCIPVRAFWDHSVKDKRCINSAGIWFSNAIFGIIIDIALIVTPIPVLKSLNLPRRQKIALILVFGIGSFACITSMLRLHALWVISHSTDPTWQNIDAASWSFVEVSVGIICACLPTLRPLFTRFLPKLLSTNSVSRTGKSFQGNDTELLSRKSGKRLGSQADDEEFGCGKTPDSAENHGPITVTTEFTVSG